MADAKVYKVLKDISIPRAVALVGENPDGTTRYQTEGRNYPAGTYVLSNNIVPTVNDRVENGEFEDTLEEVSGREADAVRELGESAEFYGTYIPEHEVESYYFRQYGHTVVPRDQVIEMKSAGADAAAENLEAARESPLNARDLPKHADEVPSLAEVSRGEEDAVVPLDSEHVEVDESVEQPPGLPVGDALAKAEGGEDAVPRKRGRPRKKQEGSGDE